VRILYLADIRLPLDRANGIQTMETCYALVERGHDVRLLVRPDTAPQPRDPFDFYGLAPRAGLRIARVPVAGHEQVRRLTYVAWAVGSVLGPGRQIDVVMTRDLTVAGLLARVPRWLRPPLVYESHGLAPVFAETRPEMISGGSAAPKAKLRRLAAREARVWRSAEGYVTITTGLADDLTRHFGPRRNLATVPDGARLPASRVFSAPCASASPVVVYAGHLYPWKGVDILLRALVHVPTARAVIAGGHPAEGDLRRLKELASSLGLEDRVTFTGFISRQAVAELLATADVLVMPHTATTVSERYASPLKLFEYMATGKPIVASDLAAVREVLRDGENACLVKPGDERALADGIARVTIDADTAGRIARRAFDEASSFTWARRAERLEPVLLEAARS
jgi:glycosyltransferase involved in cell wall biosynthesis